MEKIAMDLVSAASIGGEPIATRFEEMLRGERIPGSLEIRRWNVEAPWAEDDARIAEACRLRAFAEAAAAKAADDLLRPKSLPDFKPPAPTPRRRVRPKKKKSLAGLFPRRTPVDPPKIWLQRDHYATPVRQDQRQQQRHDERCDHFIDAINDTILQERRQRCQDHTSSSSSSRDRTDSSFLRKQQLLIEKYKGALMPKNDPFGGDDASSSHHDSGAMDTASSTWHVDDCLYGDTWLKRHFAQLIQPRSVPVPPRDTSPTTA